jgi:DNA-binding NtrC family response regulator
MASVLVVDDEPAIRATVRALLERQGWRVDEAATASEGLAALVSSDLPEVALVDLRLPDREGTVLLEEVRRRGLPIEVVVISGHGSIPAAVGAVRAGAFDFLEKPLDRERLLITLRNAARQASLARHAADDGPSPEAGSPAMRTLLEQAARFAGSDAPLLIAGETGSGKEVLARFIHARSPRRGGPFTAVNCAALPESLAESELFGHAKGAFTGADGARKGRFQAAEGGTLFLDEVGDLSPLLQAKLLRALEEGSVTPVGSDREVMVDVRIVTASHRDLRDLASRGLFREDLYFRVAGLVLEVPPLRERPEDVPLLAARFLGEAFSRQGWTSPELRPGFLSALIACPWPGNVRQLRWAVERAALLAGPAPPGPEHLPEEVRAGGTVPSGSLAGTRRDAEGRAIAAALERCGGNVARAARELGLSRSRFYEKLEELRLSPASYRAARGVRRGPTPAGPSAR